MVNLLATFQILVSIVAQACHFLRIKSHSLQWQNVLRATSPAGRAQEEKATRISSNVDVNCRNNRYVEILLYKVFQVLSYCPFLILHIHWNSHSFQYGRRISIFGVKDAAPIC